MSKKYQRPFQNLTPDNWLNLILVGLIALYIPVIGNVLLNLEMCGNVANDYCAYWSVGKVINNYGFSEMYNLDLLANYQKQVFPQGNTSFFNVVPVPYFPVFVLPFTILSKLNLTLGYIIWEIINLVGFFIYLRFFSKKVTSKPLSIKWVLLLFALSWQVILDLFYGQVNILLMVFTGEFIRGVTSGKPFKAGLWLSGLLLKPQLLILILLFLLIQRSFKALAGFVTSAFSVLTLSFTLYNLSGFLSLLDLLLKYSRGAPTNSIEIMMNWRMIGVHISSLVNPTIGWVIIGLGSLITIGAPFFIFGKKRITEPAKRTIAYLGVFSATCAATWHAHLPMSTILIPIMIFLMLKNRLGSKIIFTWVLLPILGQLIGILTGPLVTLDYLSMNINTTRFIQILGGISGFVINLGLLGWAIHQFTHDYGEQPIEGN